MASNQEGLADTIKAVHARLRSEYLKGEDEGTLWSRHVKDKPVLLNYAKSMQELAVTHWQKHSLENRIDWCYKYLTSYFAADGVLCKLCNKDQRTLEFHDGSMSSQDPKSSPDLKCCGSIFNCLNDLKLHQNQVVDEFNRRKQMKTISLPLISNIKLIDVGSCYAPFSKFSEFDCLSIDLCPANKEVMQCDFLNVEIKADSDGTVGKSIENKGDTSILRLPANHFHGVVFSLLLEYMPSPSQRWKCCLKAHQILQVDGVLLVVTPDSNKQHRRVQQMKDWKFAIESIGFQRCFYEKKQHIHCMAFRKTHKVTTYDTVTDNSKYLYIPQDYNTKVESLECQYEVKAKRPRII